MEQLLSLLSEETFFGFLLLFARIVAFVSFMPPIFNHSTVNPTLRVSIAFYLTIFLYPLVELEGDFSQERFILSLISEVTLGLIASFFLHVIFAAVRIIGELVEYATALSMASMFDATSGTNSGLVNRFLYLVALMLFFQTGMYEITIIMLVKSFSMVHLGTFDIFSYDGIQIAIDEIQRMFAFAFSFALPLFFVGFILDIYYGYGTKSMPAFSPFVITFQLKFALIFIFLILGMEVFTDSFTNYMINKFE